MSLSAHIASQIYSNFAFTPTEEQKKLIDALANYLTSQEPDAIFLLNGYAGTGKTTVIGALVRTLRKLELGCVLLAPTGRAAKVMSRYAESEAFTIHKKIYREHRGGDGTRFELNFNKSADTLYIIDEASMLTGAAGMGDRTLFGSGNLIDDLFDYVRTGRNNRVLLVGDGAQLPPIGYDRSPALDPRYMSNYGTVQYHTLSQVVRQQSESGILYNATMIREQIEDGVVDVPQFSVGFPDIRAITGAELIDELDSCYGRYGQSETAVITRSNKRAGRFNQGIRNSVLGYEEELDSGDMLMVVKNNYRNVERDPQARMDFIANGDVARIRRIYRTQERHGFHFAYAWLEFPDYDDYRMECWVLLDTLHTDAPGLTREQSDRLFASVEADYVDIKAKGKRYRAILEDEFYGALQVKFAYAFTAHKAQGGQWSVVFLDAMLFGQEQMTIELMRWLYTAVTRATERLYLISYDERFFPPEENSEEEA